MYTSKLDLEKRIEKEISEERQIESKLEILMEGQRKKDGEV